jgi:hypothetical protein
VANFTSVSLTGIGRVTVRQTGNESLAITAEDNVLPLLEARVIDGNLRLGVRDYTHLDPTKPIEFVLEVKQLDKLELTGAGSIKVEDLQNTLLSVLISGAGNVFVAGRTTTLEVEISGTGGFDGQHLTAKHATVVSSGVGNSVVNASETLDATVSGVGSIEYIGSPKVNSSVSGVGKVKQR